MTTLPTAERPKTGIYLLLFFKNREKNSEPNKVVVETTTFLGSLLKRSLFKRTFALEL